jgi:ribonuclease J
LSKISVLIHRAANEIGGNCIEIATEKTKILLDIGAPLNNLENFLPKTLNLKCKIDGVLISHPHQDHYGHLQFLPKEWPVYCGKSCEKLMKLSVGIFGNNFENSFNNWQSGQSLQIGDFEITPYLTDHSAFDAHMILIRAYGKSILYTGDFRTHGRKARLLNAMIEKLPNIDTLIIEGTNIGTNKATKSETELENDFINLFNSTKGRVFLAWSAQNIDRTISIYRACLKTGRNLFLDAYSIDVLQTLRIDYPSLPQIGWRNLGGIITKRLSQNYKQRGKASFINDLAKSGRAIGVSKLKNLQNAVIMVRSGALFNDYQNGEIALNPDDSFCWSNWGGYLNETKEIELQNWFTQNDVKMHHIHTSGHANAQELTKFAKAVAPNSIIPIHGENWQSAKNDFANLKIIENNEHFEI